MLTMPIPAERMLNDAQAAAFLGCQPQTLAVWRCRGCSPTFVRVGRLVRYRESDLRAWLESRTVKSEAE